MIKKYIYGSPIETGAVVIDMFPENGKPDMFYEEDYKPNCLEFGMTDADVIYGLGEANRGINKRGYIYTSFCNDDPVHTEEKLSLYGAHNFILVDGFERFGVFVDTPSKLTFDIGFTDSNILSIECETGDFALYIITGESLYDIVRQFRGLIGRSYIAPKWAFGFQQSRWGYRTADDVRKVVKKYRESGIPLDAVYLDIDYMERYKDFTVDKKSFPNFKEFVAEMKYEGIHLVPIIDAAVKIEDGYDVYVEGVRDNHFCKTADGRDFTAGVWPGKTHFPDFLNSKTRKWFGDKYKTLVDDGIEGFWNDMNEPAIFYSEKGLASALEAANEAKGKDLDINSFFALKDKFTGLSNSDKDYASFYHNMDGKVLCHELVHNLYGYNMTRAAAEAFERFDPDKRMLIFSRASYIGMHRYGGIWTGDNQSWWAHILMNIKQMPSLNMCGFLYTGADLGGFGGNCTRDLLLRWLAFGIFTPLMRNHSALGTRAQECYNFGNTEDFKNIISIRYSLIPYIYSEYMKAALSDKMMFRPLSFDYPEDSFASSVEDQLMFGDGLMLTPVYTQNARGRYVYLPEDMLYIKFKSPTQRKYALLPKGYHFIDVALNEVPLFMRKNKLLPLCKPTDRTDNIDTSRFEVIAYADRPCEYVLYDDDGYTTDYDKPEHFDSIAIKEDVNGKLVIFSNKQIVKVSLFN